MKQLSYQKQMKSIYLMLTLLYFLNVTDILFTLLFMQTNAFEEWNPLILWASKKPPLVLSLKCILIGGLLIYLAFRLKKATDKHLQIAKIAIWVLTIFYGSINILHIGSFVLYKFYEIL